MKLLICFIFRLRSWRQCGHNKSVNADYRVVLNVILWVMSGIMDPWRYMLLGVDVVDERRLLRLNRQPSRSEERYWATLFDFLHHCVFPIGLRATFQRGPLMRTTPGFLSKKGKWNRRGSHVRKLCLRFAHLISQALTVQQKKKKKD